MPRSLVALLTAVAAAGPVVGQTYTFTTLASFTAASGSGPAGGLVRDAAGNLYGTTGINGPGGGGTVFEVTAGSGTVTVLAAFNVANGSGPRGTLLRDAAGNLYGTTVAGGASGSNGTVFKVAAGSGVVTTLATFDGANGARPYSGLVRDAAGTLYGTASGGGANGNGTVFAVAAGSGTVTTLAAFDDTNGASPQGELLRDAAGNLYGTASQGGAYGKGTVFEVAAGSGVITTLATFDTANGAYPYGGLLRDAAGNLYGTTAGGGANDKGTVFRVAAGSGALTTLATFDGTNGATPFAELTLDANGNLFGTTTGGGFNGYGTVFMLSPTPEPATLLGVAAVGLGVAGWVRRRRGA